MFNLSAADVINAAIADPESGFMSTLADMSNMTPGDILSVCTRIDADELNEIVAITRGAIMTNVGGYLLGQMTENQFEVALYKTLMSTCLTTIMMGAIAKEKSE